MSLSAHNRLLNTLTAGAVQRYHAAPTVPSQTVAAHSWGVMVILLYITAARDLSPALLTEAALHDAGELFTGDIPYTFKRDNPAIRATLQAAEHAARAENVLAAVDSLTARETALLKVADTLEGLHHCTSYERGTLIRDRWLGAYHNARDKFNTDLSRDEWARADALFHFCGGRGTGA